MDTDVNYEDKHGEPIKLFVGQIPKSWEEAEVRQILEPFGPIQELTVLKDRTTGLHRGRCWREVDVIWLMISWIYNLLNNKRTGISSKHIVHTRSSLEIYNAL